METVAGETHAQAEAATAQDPLTILRVAGEEAMRVASAAFALLRAELRLARSSAFVLFYGVGAIALANIIGVIVVLLAMRGCWRDLSLPRTRRVLADLREPSP